MPVSNAVASGYYRISAAASHAKDAVEGKYSDIKQSSIGSKVNTFAATLKKVVNVPINFVKSHPKLIAGVGIATTAIGGLTANPAAIGIGIALIGVGTLGYMSSRHAESKAMNQTTIDILQNPNKVLEMRHESAVAFLQKATEKYDSALASFKKVQAEVNKAQDDVDKAKTEANNASKNPQKAQDRLSAKEALLAEAAIKSGKKVDALQIASLNVAQAKVFVAATKYEFAESQLDELQTEYLNLPENEVGDRTELDVGGKVQEARLELMKAKQDLANEIAVQQAARKTTPSSVEESGQDQGRTGRHIGSCSTTSVSVD
ncbi:hypothetical protein AC791_05390 [Klebsiella sp. RIT-PI-d]|uniref:hypothetical protein n=1 Tax=Klebsiella sp. RIT-PI-d TaxID=1681196 RepID=UPI0006760C6C|nr:hypothetical protein [Klebsiella sp. RIT-PI-d]KNC11367.1 hypothetical protein AC791_05390 [Klebsiella sp. RIT-PI-d]